MKADREVALLLRYGFGESLQSVSSSRLTAQRRQVVLCVRKQAQDVPRVFGVAAVCQQGFSQGEEGLCLLQDLRNGDPVLQVFSDESPQLLHSSTAPLLQHVELTPKTNKITEVKKYVSLYSLRKLIERKKRLFLFLNWVAPSSHLKSCSFTLSCRFRSVYRDMSWFFFASSGGEVSSAACQGVQRTSELTCESRAWHLCCSPCSVVAARPIRRLRVRDNGLNLMPVRENRWDASSVCHRSVGSVGKCFS